MSADRTPRTLVIVPTFNEIENLETVLRRLFAAVPLAHVLIVDDASPDGTGTLADTMAAADDRVFVLHRTEKLGLGSAYILGFDWALARDYEMLVEMDADGSHPPETLPEMLSLAAGASAAGLAAGLAAAVGTAAFSTAAFSTAALPPGLVIGSRWVRGGRVTNWPWHRLWLSRSANTYARLVLGIRIKDSTAGFRVFRASALRDIRLDQVDSKGYCFQVDMTLRVLDAGYDIVEVPIEFQEREHGESKMSQGIVVEAMRRVTVWGLQRRFGRRARRRRSSRARGGGGDHAVEISRS